MRIAVIGPQNTGKSTFVKDFLKEFPHYITKEETYRDVIEQDGLEVNQKTTLESQRAIRDFMFGQLRHNTDYNIVFDRCMIDNFVYTSVAYEAGNIPKWFLDETEGMMKDTLQLIDLYLFIPTAVSIPLVDDGTRDIDKGYIDTVNNHFLRVLFDVTRKYHLNVKVISGTREERIAQARKLV